MALREALLGVDVVQAALAVGSGRRDPLALHVVGVLAVEIVLRLLVGQGGQVRLTGLARAAGVAALDAVARRAVGRFAAQELVGVVDLGGGALAGGLLLGGDGRGGCSDPALNGRVLLLGGGGGQNRQFLGLVAVVLLRPDARLVLADAVQLAL